MQQRAAQTGLSARPPTRPLSESPLSLAAPRVWQTRKMVFLKHEQTGIPLEQAVDELQKDFEVAMEAVVTSIRRKHEVTEQQMTQVMVAYQADAEVQTAVTTLREAMSGKAPAKQAASPETAKAKPVRRAKPRQRKG